MSGILVRREMQQGRAAKLVDKVPVVLTKVIVKDVVERYLQLISIDDKRQAGKIRFSAVSLLFTVTLAYLCGNRSACAVGKFWAQHQAFLQAVLPSFPQQVVSHDTIKRSIENVVFDKFTLFLTRFTESLIYESLNYLHLCDRLPANQHWLFTQVLKEHSTLEREHLVYDTNSSHYVSAQPSQLRPFQMVVYNSSGKLSPHHLQMINQQKEFQSILKQLREYEFQDSAVHVTFMIEK